MVLSYLNQTFTLNKHGFIATLEEAQTLSNFTNEQIKEKEPILWLPWVILDTPYKN